MLKWTIGVTLLVIAIIWALVFALSMPLWLGGALTGLVLVIAVIVGIVLHLRQSKAAKQLEQALAMQAKKAADNLRPDMAAEVKAMAAELEKAVAALKASKVGGGGTAALYALPWYALIGPPGAGKTTAIRNSGLHFPYLSDRSRQGAIQGIGGTRNCDWWLTNEAVLLDTAGRWTTGTDNEDWFAFLDLIKKNRPKQPLNGVIVGVGYEEIARGSDESLIALAKRLRERLDEIILRLGTRVPVYIVLTKCDRIPGFMESFSELPASERGQLWGFTLPYQVDQTVGEACGQAFGKLQKNLEKKALSRTAEARTARARIGSLELPRQIEGASPRISAFADLLFQKNMYAESPTLRGIYFTSGTQEAQALDRLAQGVAQAAGLQGGQPTQTEGRTYFLRDVFQRVVFKDASLARPTDKASKQMRFAQIAAAAIAALLSLAAGFISLRAFSVQRERIESSATILENPMPTGRPSDLARIGVQLSRLSTPTSVLSNLGFSHDEQLASPLRSLHATEARRLAATLVARDTSELRAEAESYRADTDRTPTAAEYQAMKQRLERYLLWTGSVDGRHRDGEPALDDSLRSNLAYSSAVALRELHPDWPETEVQSATATMLRALTETMPVFERDPRIVAGTRLVLRRLRPERVALDMIVSDDSTRSYDISVNRLVGQTGNAITSNARIRGVFTRSAWDEVVRLRLESAASQAVASPWVMGIPETEVEAATAEMLALVRSEYFAAYIEEWKRFLDTVAVRQPSGEVETLTLLQDLTRGTPAPLGRLIEGVKHNTTLLDPEPEPTAAEQAADLVATRARGNAARVLGAAREALADDAPVNERLLTNANVAEAFESLTRFGVAESEDSATSLDVFHEQLAFVRDALQALRDDPSQSEQLLARLQEGRTRVRALIEAEPIGFRPRLEAWLWPPLEGASLTSSQSVAAGAARGWCGDVAVPFVHSLEGKYPFTGNGEDSSVADFAAFFRPGTGNLWGHYTSSLATNVTREGDHYVIAARLGQGGNDFVGGLTRYLENAQAVTDAFFPPNEANPRVDLQILVHPTPSVASIRLSVGGTAIEYRNGREVWSRISWPGENPTQGASLEIRGAGGRQERLRREGDWGLFRLLEDARVERTNATTMRVSWTMPGQGVNIVMDIRTSRSQSPFYNTANSRLLSPLRALTRVPRDISTSGESTCRVR